MNIEMGSTSPLGVSRQGKGLNFALYSEHANAVSLCLFSPLSKQPFAEIPLNKTGPVWHILLKNLTTERLEYGYRIGTLILSDPYSRGLSTSQEWGHRGIDEEKTIPRSKIILDTPFDWQYTRKPNIAPEEVILYEMHVRSFTKHVSSQTKAPGTFLGIIEKIPYLKNLGINAVELMPIFEFDECQNVHTHPKTGAFLKNMWGYATMNFFSPMNRYSSSRGWNAALDDFRMLVREMHKNGIEVYLDVVYNHTAEDGNEGPAFSFKGIDNSVYYMLQPDGDYFNFSGTGNTFNANHPAVMALILDSLRFFANEMQVDGFRFDLASCLTRDQKGTPLANPPLIAAISSDPDLTHVKLIAEAWDAAGLYQVGHFPGGSRWHEWNGVFRDTVRRFIKGTDGQASAFASALLGSKELYASSHRRPYHSINFVTAHDGYTLRDLVTYQNKHNEDNGEENRDGANDNESWNCGQEGPTQNRKINVLREKQMRNFHTALMVAIGTPMILMSDEYGHTRHGNNNAYCQDNELNWFLWDELEKNAGFARFHRLMVQFRNQNPLLKRRDFIEEHDINWHGHEPLKPNWAPENRFVAYTLNDLYIAFNAHFQEAYIHLPPPPPGKQWYRIVDTSLFPPNDITEDFHSHPLKYTYTMQDHSALIARAF